jgi:hypothetical protein
MNNDHEMWARSAEMAPFFVDLEGRPDEGFLLLEEVFHLEDQLRTPPSG